MSISLFELQRKVDVLTTRISIMVSLMGAGSRLGKMMFDSNGMKPRS